MREHVCGYVDCVCICSCARRFADMCKCIHVFACLSRSCVDAGTAVLSPRVAAIDMLSMTVEARSRLWLRSKLVVPASPVMSRANEVRVTVRCLWAPSICRLGLNPAEDSATLSPWTALSAGTCTWVSSPVTSSPLMLLPIAAETRLED